MRRGFTLIELLIVIGIIGILSTVVLLTLNPTELLKQSRDSTRIAELTSLDKAIGFASAQNPDLVLGVANTVYVSLPDTSATCATHAAFLPTLAPTWQYRCVTAVDLRKIDGNGWLPINFTSLTIVPVDTLAVDRSNSAQLGLYYTYAFQGTRWELNAEMESTKYRWGGGADVESTDGGNTIVLYEKGSGLNSVPKESNWRIGYELKIPITCVNTQNSASNLEFYSRWTIPGTGQAAVVKLLYWPNYQAFNPGTFMQMAMYGDGTFAQRKRISNIILVEGQGSGNWTSSSLDFTVPITLGNTYVFGFGPQDDFTNAYYTTDSSPYCANYLPAPPIASWSESGSFPLNDNAGGASDAGHHGIFGIYYSL